MSVLKRVLFCTFVFLCFTSRVAFAAAHPTDPKLDQPPAGIQPASISFPSLIAHHDKAIGKRSSLQFSAVWTISHEGTVSTESLKRNGSDYNSTITKGSLTETYGQFLGHSWHQDFNGVIFTTSAIDAGSFAMYRVLADAQDPKNDVKVLGRLGDAYVVEVKNSSWKHPEWVYYDAKTYLVTRTENIEDGSRVVSTYGDFRATNGVVEPWHIHDSTGNVGRDINFQQTALSFAPVDPSLFGVPKSTQHFTTIDKHYELPSHFINTDIIVRLDVNGRGLDFTVSSGSRRSLIDSEVAREIGLPTFGHAAKINGKNVSFDTIIPSASIGDLQLKQFAVRAVTFHYHARDDVKVVGVLGADFLASGVFNIDYVNGLFTLDPESVFHPETSLSGYPAVPIDFDDGQPFIQGSIGGHIAKHFLVDNGFYWSVATGELTTRYPDALPDMRGDKHAHVVVPFADKKSYGRDVDVWIANVPDIVIGPVHFRGYRVIATDANLENSGYDPDFVVGSDFLHFFDVHLDYQNGRMYLKPNKWFLNRFKATP